MAEVDTIFSNDDAFFGIATGPNEQTHFNPEDDNEDEDYENNPMYDPPSKICGGAVFNRFRTAGKKHNKTSVDLNAKKNTKEYFQKQRNLPLSGNALVNKFTNKIMRRKKDSSTADAEEETSHQETSYKQELIVPSSIHLSSMSKSTSSSPWVTDDSFDNDDDVFLLHPHQHKKVMGDSTTQFANGNVEPNTAASNDAGANNTSRSRRNLHILLDEMKDFNDLVQERSNVLQRGIANIAIELEEEIQEEIKPSTVATPRPEIQVETCNDMEKLEQERSFYRSEAETLRLEMKEIKAQLDEIKRCLPTMNNSNTEALSRSKSTTVSDSEEDEIRVPSPYPTKSRRVRSPRSPRFLRTLDLPPLADSSKLTFRNELHDILTDLGRTNTTRVMRNAEAIVQQHHYNHPDRENSIRDNSSIDNCSNSRNGTASDAVKQKKAEFYKYQQDSAPVSTSSISLSIANRSLSGYPINNSENSLSAKARRSMTDKTYRELRRRFREQQETSTISEISAAGNDEVAIVSPSSQNGEESAPKKELDARELQELEELRQSWHELLNAPSDTSTNKTDTSAEF